MIKKDSTELIMKKTLHQCPVIPELTETPKKDRTECQEQDQSPGSVKRRRPGGQGHRASPYRGHGSPFKGGRSQSFSSLHKLQSSPSQLSAKRLVRKYNSVLATSRQRQEITSLRRSLPHLKAASSDLDLVLEAITYIQQLQERLVTMADTKSSENKVEERLV